MTISNDISILIPEALISGKHTGKGSFDEPKSEVDIPFSDSDEWVPPKKLQTKNIFKKMLFNCFI